LFYLHVTGFSDKEREHVGQEMSDILIYLVRLADKCRIDLPSVVLKKIDHNGLKYPVHKVKGKNNKYTDYETGDNEEHTEIKGGSEGENRQTLS
jgi:dCTP diphosphatase